MDSQISIGYRADSFLEGSLKGLRVIDFTQVAAGPTCTMMLGDRGADVIKVETPEGDLGRSLGPPFISGHSTIFLSLNRNKRSLVLDLKSDTDCSVAQQLVRTADIVVESFRPGVMQKLGLGYEHVAQTNPRVVYASISAYGQTGEYRNRPGVDGIIQASSGLMSVVGGDDDNPTKVQPPIVDIVTGLFATTAILDALMMRAKTGAGAWLDISMFAASLQLQQTAIASFLASDEVPVPCGSGAPYAAPNEAFPAEDGWVMIAAYHPKRWIALCEALDLPAVQSDPRFATSELRVANRASMHGAISTATRKFKKFELLQMLESRDIICGPVNTYRDLEAFPPFADHLISVVQPEVGVIRGIGPLGSLSAAYRKDNFTPAPALGQHTADIRAELAAVLTL